MKKLLLIVGASTLLVAPYHARAQTAQTQTAMTTSEFREVLVDMGATSTLTKARTWPANLPRYPTRR